MQNSLTLTHKIDSNDKKQLNQPIQNPWIFIIIGCKRKITIKRINKFQITKNFIRQKNTRPNQLKFHIKSVFSLVHFSSSSFCFIFLPLKNQFVFTERARDFQKSLIVWLIFKAWACCNIYQKKNVCSNTVGGMVWHGMRYGLKGIEQLHSLISVCSRFVESVKNANTHCIRALAPKSPFKFEMNMNCQWRGAKVSRTSYINEKRLAQKKSKWMLELKIGFWISFCTS